MVEKGRRQRRDGVLGRAIAVGKGFLGCWGGNGWEEGVESAWVRRRYGFWKFATGCGESRPVAGYAGGKDAYPPLGEV